MVLIGCSVSNEPWPPTKRSFGPRLADEFAEPLPAFEDVYGFVQAFYESLPW